ncbi:hypothetical protein [Actinomadura rugatobispora]|uniref:Uncharacterized protein n=1 Tax=Actinomadura rugatobispora TaxID=1994 RepID=A0ABW1AHR3_9ACTN|nr:hypothetical protein GCM10010200_073560 [Actinomadura rugatobispora]
MTAQMRTGPAARHADFRGIDPPALGQLIKQVQDANTAIRSWLNGHRPPPGVSAAGYRQAEQAAQWAADQLGMLTRRHAYAMTHPDGGGGVEVPPAPAPLPRTPGTGTPGPGGTPEPVRAQPPRGSGSPARPPSTTPNGAGDLGNFPTRQDAAKAAKADALAVAAAVQDRRPVPEQVWKHLKENAGDPDYTEKLYERLGPAAAADLLKAAAGDQARVGAVRESLGTASHHLTMDVRWLRAFLAEADRAGVHPVAVQVLTGADMSRRTREAIGKLDLQPVTGRRAG